MTSAKKKLASTTTGAIIKQLHHPHPQVQQMMNRGQYQLRRQSLPPYKQHHLPNLFQSRRTPESTPLAFEKPHLKKPQLELISHWNMFPQSVQIAQELNHARYPLNEREKQKPHLMKKRDAIFRNPQSVNHEQFNCLPMEHDASVDPNGNLTLRDALLVNMIADDVQSELLISSLCDNGVPINENTHNNNSNNNNDNDNNNDNNDNTLLNSLKPKIGMPYDRITPQHAHLSQSRTVDTVTLNLDQILVNSSEQQNTRYVNATEHGKVLSVNLTATWTNPSRAKYDDDNEDRSSFQIWEHSFLHGNWVRPHMTQSSIPTLLYPSDTTVFDAEKLYSVLLVTNDYPHRLHADPGVFVHWWVANIPGTNDCQVMNQFIREQMSENKSKNVIFDYLAPLPCEYGGVGRYYVLVYEQSSGDLIDRQSINLHQYREMSIDAKYRSSRRFMQHLSKMSRQVNWYEKEHVHAQINEKMIHDLAQFDASALAASDIGDSEYRLNGDGNGAVDAQVLQSYNERRGMSLAKMFNNQLPHGLCYAKIEYEYSVTEYLQSKGMSALEREYVPPDLAWKRVLNKNQFVKRQDKYIHSDQWL